MNSYALFPTISSITVLCIGLYVFIKNSKLELNKVFLILCCCFFIWHFSFSLVYWLQNVSLLTSIIHKIALFAIIFAPVVLLHFLLVFFRNTWVKYINLLYVLALFMSLIGAFSNCFFSGVILKFWGLYPIAGKFLYILMFQQIILIAVALYVLYVNFKKNNFNPIKKEQIKYLLFGYLLLIFSFLDFLTMFSGINIYPIGYLVVLLFAISISFCLLKTNLISFNLFILEVITLILLYSCIFGIPLFIWKKTYNSFLSVSILFFMSLCGPNIFILLKTKIENLILSEQEQYHKKLLKMSDLILQEEDIFKLSKMIVLMLKSIMKVKCSAIFICSQNKNSYFCTAQRGMSLKNKNIFFNDDSEIINYIKSKKNPFILPEFFEKDNVLCNVVNESCPLVVPINNINGLVAFVVIGNKKNKSLYSQKDLNALKILSNEIRIAIENCNFFREMKNQQKKLFYVSRLAQIGNFADGFANQLKNRLNQFYLVGEGINYELSGLKNVSEYFMIKEEGSDMILSYIGQIADSIVDNVKESSSVLQNVLSFIKTDKNTDYFSSFSLKYLVEQCLQLVRIKYQKEHINLVLHLPQTDYIYGIRNQIQRIIFNCLDNSYYAICEKKLAIKNSKLSINDYKPQITIELKYVNNYAKIYIQDNGIGINSEDTDKVFSAFFTTKFLMENNTGISLYVVKKIIENIHKGDIKFKSKYGYGSTFLISLPMNK